MVFDVATPSVARVQHWIRSEGVAWRRAGLFHRVNFSFPSVGTVASEWNVLE